MYITFIFYVPEDGQTVGRNTQITACIQLTLTHLCAFIGTVLQTFK